VQCTTLHQTLLCYVAMHHKCCTTMRMLHCGGTNVQVVPLGAMGRIATVVPRLMPSKKLLLCREHDARRLNVAPMSPQLATEVAEGLSDSVMVHHCATPQQITPRYPMRHYNVVYYTTLCYTTLCYTTLCHAVLHCTTLHHTPSNATQPTHKFETTWLHQNQQAT